MSILSRYRSSIGIIDGSSWLDQSGNGNHLEQLIAIDQPTLVPNSYNGWPVVRFGTTELMTALTSAMNDITTNDMTLTVVMIPVSVLGERVIISKASNFSGAVPGYAMERSLNANRPWGSVFGGSNTRSGWEGTALTDFVNHSIISYKFNSTPNTSNLYVNGSADEVSVTDTGTVTASLSNAVKFQVGYSAGFGMEADVLDIILHDSGEDMAAIYAELNALYSVPPVTDEVSTIIPPIIESSIDPILNGIF